MQPCNTTWVVSEVCKDLSTGHQYRRAGVGFLLHNPFLWPLVRHMVLDAYRPRCHAQSGLFRQWVWAANSGSGECDKGLRHQGAKGMGPDMIWPHCSLMVCLYGMYTLEMGKNMRQLLVSQTVTNLLVSTNYLHVFFLVGSEKLNIWYHEQFNVYLGKSLRSWGKIIPKG